MVVGLAVGWLCHGLIGVRLCYIVLCLANRAALFTITSNSNGKAGARVGARGRSATIWKFLTRKNDGGTVGGQVGAGSLLFAGNL